jgi:hypothetical protein
MRVLVRFATLVLGVVLVPSVAYAQSSIAGIVRDTSGAVLPGVTVEASSDALIEKVRSAVSDGNGQYRIVDLRPGTYSVTFTLAGFSVFKRDEVSLPADFVATVNADMRVGALEETITVTGESPVVDIQSARRQRTLDNEMIQSLPTARAYNGLVRLIPSMTGGTNDVVLSPGMIVFGGRGGRANEGRVQVDGINTGASLNGGGVSGYRQDIENSAEVAISTSGGMGEVEVGGPAMNIVPKSGGNNFTGHLFATGFNDALQSDNFTDKIRFITLPSGTQQANPLAAPNSVNYNFDVSVSSGGPIKRDRLWYFTQVYYRGASNDISMFFNRNAGDLTKWTYEADPSRQAQNVGRGPMQPYLTLNVQLTQRNKLRLFWDEQISNNSIGQGSATSAPETGGYNHGFQRVQQVRWTSTATNRLLLEAGMGTYLSNWNTRERPDNDRRFIDVTEQCTATCVGNGGIANLNYRGQATWNADWIGAHTWNSAMSYITGTHSMKFGYQGAYHVDDRAPGGQTVSYRVNNGIPNQLTERLRDYRTHARVKYHAFYAQDQMTRGRLTLSGGLRYDHSWSEYPEQSIGGTFFLPAVTTFVARRGVEGYHDVTPRMGAVYDLFGTGKTALKFNAGRYLEAAVNANGNYSSLLPTAVITTTVTRTWTDRDQDFNPDCDLRNPLAQSTTVDFCGQISQLAFGQSNPTTTYDPAILQGWGVRPADWQIGVTVQHEILPRVSLEVGYARRWLQNFTVTDNLARAPGDYGSYSVTAPLDPRLPGGGGYVVSGLFDANQNVASVTNNYATYAPNYGKQYSRYNGLELNVSARMRGGLQFQAGSSTGETVTDNCEIRAKLPEINPTNPYCHNAPGVTTRATGAASYTIPKIDVLVAGTFQSSPGAVLAANYNVTTAIVAQSLGRPLSNSATSVSINLLRPGEMYGERVNQIDLRIGKTMRYGRMRSTLSVDMFNLLNPDTVLNRDQTFNNTWLRPTSVMTARTIKLTLQHDF